MGLGVLWLKPRRSEGALVVEVWCDNALGSRVCCLRCEGLVINCFSVTVWRCRRIVPGCDGPSGGGLES